MNVAAGVTDFNALLFHTAGRTGRLGRKAAAHFDACEKLQALVYVPAVVVWEISLLSRRRRISVKGGVRDYFESLFSNPAYQPFDLNPEQVYLADEIRVGNDPFDNLICAAAINLGLPLITADATLASSEAVPILWD